MDHRMSRKISNQHFLRNNIYRPLLRLKTNRLSNEQVHEANVSVSRLDLEENLSGAEFFKPISPELFNNLHQPTL